MKKRTILALASFLLLSLSLASPYLLERRPLQERLLGYVEQALGVKATVGEIGWRWLPVPSITITRLKAETTSFSLVLPQAQLLLSPLSFFSPQVSLARARLIEPELIIKKGGSALLEAFPAGRLSIVNGRLSMPGHTIGQELTMQAATLTAVNGTVSSRAHSLNFDLTASTDIVDKLGIKGSVDLHQGHYLIDGGGEGFDSSRLFGPLPSNSLLPVVTGLNFSLHLEGQGPERFQLRIGSKKSPFTFQWRNESFQVAGLDALTVSRERDDVTIDLTELSLSEPRFRLNGRVARLIPGEKATALPEWFIDLSGADIDLGSVRSSILAIFGDHPVAKKVCSIVRGGGATTARYLFKGVVADFKHLANMKIWAEAKDVPLTIPKLGLVLDQASGPIAIIDDRLTGKGLTATIDKSQGVNGDLLLDLAKDRHAFALDLDLDADLQNLQDVLSQVVPSTRFQEELRRFVKIKGRAQGHLRLGDELHHVQTVVDVRSVEASGLYDRLSWPFTIGGGRLRVAPQQLDWEGLHGTLGKQKIRNSMGGVTWRDDVSVDLKALDADLDLKSFYEEGELRVSDSATLAVRNFMLGKVYELSGQARLTHSLFSGPIGRPEEWQYHTTISCSDLVLAGAGLPELYSQSVEAEISQQQANFAGIFALFDQEIFLSGLYQHNLLGKWHGDLEIDGDIGKRLGEWLQEKDLFPVATFPKLPFRLEKFVITNQESGLDSFLAKGTIIPLSRKTDARLQLSISRQPDQSISTFTFLNGTRQGSFSYQAWPDQKDRNLLTWQGGLTFETLDALFPQQVLQSGQIDGEFSRLTEQGATDFNGSLQVKGVTFQAESLTPDLTLDTLRLRGNNSGTISVEQADLSLAGVPATVSGRVTEAEGLHTLDLRLAASKLAWKSIQKVFDAYAQRATSAARGKDGKSLFDLMRGTIAFDIGAFDYIRQVGSKERAVGVEGSHTFTATPFKGGLTLRPSGIDMQVTDSRVCGISTQGSWHFRDESSDDTVSFSNGQTPLFFEKALPCLGIKQSLIIGPFSLEGEIRGRPKHWRQGAISLTSQEGLIKRMVLLSKIFTAVNVTDYFTWRDLPDMEGEGLSYNELSINGHVDDNNLILDRTIIKGKGVNLSGRGFINLTDLNSDLTFFIAPFKTIDWVVTSLPLIGKALGGPKESILTFPVAVSGNLRSPEVTALAPQAVGSAFLELFRDTVTLPFRIFQPEEKTPEFLGPLTKPPPAPKTEGKP